MFSKETINKMLSNECLSDKESAEIIEDMVNVCGFNADKVGKRLTRVHRYLVQEFFKMCLTFIVILADNYRKGNYDGRNEWSCKMADAMMQGIRNAEGDKYANFLLDRANDTEID